MEVNQNYSYYNTCSEDELADDEYFRQWVLNSDSESDEFWSNYQVFYPSQRQSISNARNKVEAGMQPLSAAEKSDLKESIYRRLDLPVSEFSIKHTIFQVLKYAAIFIPILLVPLFIVHKKNAPLVLITESTGFKEVKTIVLPDSSEVILNANSSLTYSFERGSHQDRELNLTGNAFFKVRKKSDLRKFIVRTNGLAVEVLGTEFNVDARSKATAVVLTRGKVKLSLDGAPQATAYMNPGEQVVLDTTNQSLKKTVIDPLLYSAWTSGKWNFSSTSLSDIARLVFEYYGIETVFPDEKTKRIKLSAVIPVTDLGSLTNILSKTLNLTIQEYHDQLHIQF